MKNERGRELGIGLPLSILGCIYAFFILMFTSGSIRAADVLMVKDAAGNTMRLYETPCKDEKVLAVINAKVLPKYASQFKGGAMFYDGKDYNACWFATNGVVYVIDDVGEQTEIPMWAFQRSTES